jgi:hypothetical protein
MPLNILLLKGRNYLFICLFLFVIFLLFSESKGKTQCDDINCREGKCINASCVCDKGWKGAACEHCTGRVRYVFLLIEEVLETCGCVECLFHG